MTIQVITENTTAINATPDDQYTGVEETKIWDANPTTNYATGNPFEVTKYDAGDHTNTLIRGDFSNIPGGSTITSAYLYLRLWGSSSSASHTISARNLLRNWVVAQATWNIYSTGNSWTTGGGLGAGTDRTDTAVATQSVGVGDVWYSWDITNWVQDIVDGTYTNYGLHLERTDGSNDSTYKRFGSSDGTDGERPEFVITYTAGGGGDPEGRLIGGKLIRGGLLRSGVL